MKSGVYTITNIINNKMYVGCGKDANKRISHHKVLLRQNKHKNGRLQNSWNKYGAENFECNVIEYCEYNEIFKREHYWATQLKSNDRKFGFNIRPTDENDKRIVSESTRRKVSKSQKGKITSEETKKLMSIAAKKSERLKLIRKPVCQYDIEGNFIKEWSSKREAHEGTGSSRNSINLQCNNDLNNIKMKKTTCKFIWKYKKD